jgi:tetratricopeptide (TPR) repeat protein
VSRRLGPALLIFAVARLASAAPAPAPPPARPPEDPNAESLKRGDAYAKLIAAGLAVARGRAAEAIKNVNDAVALEPTSSALHAQGAALLALLGRRADAERLANRALEIDPGQLEAVKVLADLEASRSFGPKADPGARQEAIRLYERLAKEDDDAPDEVWSALARLKLATGDMAGAAADAEKYLLKRPADSNALRLYDQTLRRRRPYERGAGPHARVAPGSPGGRRARPLVVEMARETGAWSTIESLCTELLARDPGNARALALRGEARLRLGRPQEALDDLELARSTTPRDPLLRLHVAAAYQALNRLADATQLGESLAAEYPENSFVHILLAETLARRGETARAREEYLRALQVITGSEEDDVARRDEVRARLAAIDLTAEKYDDAKATLALARAAGRLGGPGASRARGARVGGSEGGQAPLEAPRDRGARGVGAHRWRGRAKDGPCGEGAESFDRAVKRAGPRCARPWRPSGAGGGHDAEAENRASGRGPRRSPTIPTRGWRWARSRAGAAVTPRRKRASRRDRLAPDPRKAFNYLGYSLADRGERLDDSVLLIKRALEIDPHNGAYLDSLAGRTSTGTDRGGADGARAGGARVPGRDGPRAPGGHPRGARRQRQRARLLAGAPRRRPRGPRGAWSASSAPRRRTNAPVRVRRSSSRRSPCARAERGSRLAVPEGDGPPRRCLRAERRARASLTQGAPARLGRGADKLHAELLPPVGGPR